MDNNKRTIQLMNKFFKKGTYKGEKGWYGYKAFETEHCPYYYKKPKHWKVVKGEVLTLKEKEKLNKNTRLNCARGIHFATMEWVKEWANLNTDPNYGKVFKVFVEKKNIDNIIVPCELTDSKWDVKVRTDRLTLVRQVDMNTYLGNRRVSRRVFLSQNKC